MPITANVKTVTAVNNHPTYTIEVKREPNSVPRKLLYRFSAFRDLSNELGKSFVAECPFPVTYRRQALGINLTLKLLEQRRDGLNKWLVSVVSKIESLSAKNRSLILDFLHLAEFNYQQNTSAISNEFSKMNIPLKFHHGKEGHSKPMYTLQDDSSFNHVFHEMSHQNNGRRTDEGELLGTLFQGEVFCRLFNISSLGGGCGLSSLEHQRNLKPVVNDKKKYQQEQETVSGFYVRKNVHSVFKNIAGSRKPSNDDDDDDEEEEDITYEDCRDDESTEEKAEDPIYSFTRATSTSRVNEVDEEESVGLHGELVASLSLSDVVSIHHGEDTCSFSIQDVGFGLATFETPTADHCSQWMCAILDARNRFLEFSTKYLDLHGRGHFPQMITITRTLEDTLKHSDPWSNCVLRQPELWVSPLPLPDWFTPPPFLTKDKAHGQDHFSITIDFIHGVLELSSQEVFDMAHEMSHHRRSSSSQRTRKSSEISKETDYDDEVDDFDDDDFELDTLNRKAQWKIVENSIPSLKSGFLLVIRLSVRSQEVSVMDVSQVEKEEEEKLKISRPRLGLNSVYDSDEVLYKKSMITPSVVVLLFGYFIALVSHQRPNYVNFFLQSILFITCSKVFASSSVSTYFISNIDLDFNLAFKPNDILIFLNKMFKQILKLLNIISEIKIIKFVLNKFRNHSWNNGHSSSSTSSVQKAYSLMFLDHIWLPSNDPLVEAIRLNEGKRRKLSVQSQSFDKINPLTSQTISDENDTSSSSFSSFSSTMSSSETSQPFLMDRISNHHSELLDGPEEEKEEGGSSLQSIPVRFRNIKGGQDLALCTETWASVVKWRKDCDVENWLQRPQPHYQLIKTCFENYICGVDRIGRPIEVLVLKSPAAVFATLKDQGITVEDIVMHMIFQHEYLWRHHFDDYDEVGTVPKVEASVIKIMDIQQFGWYDIGGHVGEYFKKMMLLSTRYPERMFKTLVINVPRSFSYVWRTIEPLLEATVRAKVFLYPAETFKPALLQLIAPNQLPERYGGSLQDYAEFRVKLFEGINNNLQEKEDRNEPQGPVSVSSSIIDPEKLSGYDMEKEMYRIIKINNCKQVET